MYYWLTFYWAIASEARIRMLIVKIFDNKHSYSYLYIIIIV